MKRVLMIAYHFPPFQGSSGIMRTLKFATYLREFGWQPIVLTAHPRAYPSTGDDLLREIPPDIVVRAAPAFDAARHFAINHRYPPWLASPDRWASWFPGALVTGIGLLWKYAPRVVWSTYPIATAHLIGRSLSAIAKVPWIADFRDPMTDADYPVDPRQRRVFARIEQRSLERCSKAVFTSPGAITERMRLYPQVPEQRYALIENGYDEESFARVQAQAVPRTAGGAPLLLLHSGTLYPSERDPRPFFQALRALRAAGKISPAEVRIVLRATGHDAYIRGLIDAAGIGDIVSLAPHLPYDDALAEMLTADALLLFQAANCNHQVPAKLYEYLRARRPILALTDPAGDTAATLRRFGIDTIVQLDSEAQLSDGLMRFLPLVRLGKAPVAGADRVAGLSRKGRTRELAELLDAIQ